MIIELLDGTQHDISNYSSTRLFHRIPSAEITHSTDNIDGLGEMNINTTIGQRTITVDLVFQVIDIYDYYLLRDELNALLSREEAFYLIFKREPYKRWLVKTADQFKLPPQPKAGIYTLEFRTVQKYAESIATTDSVKDWDSDIWGWNDNISWDDDLTYSFTTNNFVVKNGGTAPIDPRESALEIIIRANAGSYLEIRNHTTGDVYRYNGTLNSNDTLTIKGVRSLKNGVSVFKDTNKKLLTLAVGENQLSVEGGILTSIDFNFRFLFK